MQKDDKATVGHNTPYDDHTPKPSKSATRPTTPNGRQCTPQATAQKLPQSLSTPATYGHDQASETDKDKTRGNTSIESITLAQMMMSIPVAIEAKCDVLLWSVMCKQAANRALIKVDARGRVTIMDGRRLENELWKLYDQGLGHMRTDRRMREHVDDIDAATWEKDVVPEVVNRRMFVEHYLKLSSMPLKAECNFLHLKGDWLSKSFTQKQVKYQVNVKWQQVNMLETKHRPFAFKSDCPMEVAVDRRKKSAFESGRTYVKLGNQSLRNLFDYVAAVQYGTVSLTDHITLCTHIERQRNILQQMYRQPIAVTVNDVEVPILHFRFELKKP